MKYDVDHEFESTEGGYSLPVLPDGLTRDREGLYLLPSGKYLPPGAYRCADGSELIYEPPQLSPYADMLADFREREDGEG